MVSDVGPMGPAVEDAGTEAPLSSAGAWVDAKAEASLPMPPAANAGTEAPLQQAAILASTSDLSIPMSCPRRTFGKSAGASGATV